MIRNFQFPVPRSLFPVCFFFACATGPKILAPSDAKIALFGQAVALHDAGQLAKARGIWLDLLGSREPALEEIAMERLLALSGEVGGEAAIAARVQALLPSLSLRARSAALELLARVARRGGDESAARGFDRERGCVQALTVAPRLGPLSHMDLEKSIPAGGERRMVVGAGCHTTLMAPDAMPGALATVLPVVAKNSFVLIDTTADWLLVRGGQVLYRHSDGKRYPAHATWLRVRAAAAPLELHLAAPSGRVELTLAVWEADHGPDGAIEEARAPELTTAGELGRLLAGYLAIARGDPVLADEIFAGGKDAHLLMARAIAASLDPSRGPTTARERARAMLEQALALQPSSLRAAYNLAQLDLQDERTRQALDALDAAAKATGAKEAGAILPFWHWQAARAQALRARGLDAEADRALEGALAAEPEACGLLTPLAAAARDRRDFIAERRYADRARRCDAESQELADLCARRGDHACAATEYGRLLAIDPSRDSLRLPLAEAKLARGDAKGAVVVLAELAWHEPRQPSYRMRLADAQIAAGKSDAARATLHQALKVMPESLEIVHALEAIGEPSPLAPFRVDARAIIADYERRAASTEWAQAPAVFLLDRTVTRAFATGARLTLTHNIIRVQTKAGIDRWGEVQIPPGADVLTLRTIKADGSTREPEEIVGKESVSAPDLLPGDYVELEYIDPQAPPAAFSDGFLAERFYFDSFEAPLDRTEYLLVVPVGTKVDVDARGGMASGQVAHRERRDDLEVYSWQKREQPELVQEPLSVPFVETVPSVRVSSGVTLEKWRDYLRDNLWDAWRANDEMRQIVRTSCQGKEPRACASALTVWVADHVEQSGTIHDSATGTLARREGNRTGLLGAMLRAAGIEPEMWLVRPVIGDATAPVPQEMDDFSEPILHLGNEFLDARTRRLPAFTLAPALWGGRALRLGDGAVATELPKPAQSATGTRRIALAARLSADGPVQVNVREQLDGWPAVEWREELDRLDTGRLRQEFEQRRLGYFFPGAQLQSLDFDGRKTGRGPLAIAYAFTAPHLLRLHKEEWAVADLLPSLLVRRFVVLPTRTTGLEVGYFPRTEVEATLELPPGARITPVAPVAFSSRFGRFTQKIWTEGTLLRISRTVELPLQRVSPDDYAQFVSFARSVDEAEEQEITIAIAP